MEKIISTLVEYDKAGQSLVQEAEESRKAELARMNEYKHQMYQDYLKKMENHLVKYREQSEAGRIEQIAQLRQEYAEQTERLQALYEQNRKKWVAEMLERCIGG